MTNEEQKPESPAATACLCNALRHATRAVSRLYDEELRRVGLRTTQYSLLRRLHGASEIRQRDLGGLTSLDETTLTRSLRPLIHSGWIVVRRGKDRREKLIRLTDAGEAKLQEARPAWLSAQQRLRSRLPQEAWSSLMDVLPELPRLVDAT
jgi:DNA-binding MarR family transcriptional regulator